MTVPLALEGDFREGARKLLDLQKPDLEALSLQSVSQSRCLEILEIHCQENIVIEKCLHTF